MELKFSKGKLSKYQLRARSHNDSWNWDFIDASQYDNLDRIYVNLCERWCNDRRWSILPPFPLLYAVFPLSGNQIWNTYMKFWHISPTQPIFSTRFLLLHKLLFPDVEIRCSYFPLHFLRFYKYFRRQCNENSHLVLTDFHKNRPGSDINLIDSIFLDYFCHPSNPSFRTIWKDLCDSIIV